MWINKKQEKLELPANIPEKNEKNMATQHVISIE